MTDGNGQREISGSFRVASWNLLRRIGAEAEDVAKLVRAYRPDLLLLQEATEEIAALPSLVGGHFFRHPMQKRIYGLAAWSPHPFPSTSALRLPASVLPGRVPPRIAQIVKFQGICFANVHLSHGQFLNRFQLHHIAYALEGPAVIMGALAWGMWRAHYWAVICFQVVLVFLIFTAVYSLLVIATTVGGFAVTVGLLAVSGTLFWLMVKAMARIQMPERPGS